VRVVQDTKILMYTVMIRLPWHLFLKIKHYNSWATIFLVCY